ncbi:hypothetical protein FRC03_012754 [Tulasnella sp. 419]|nr:hypothetical protein FRC03_012754 [Tulasnella sp. 419]
MSDAVTSKTSEDTSMATDTSDHPVQEQTKATPEKEDDDDSGEEEDEDDDMDEDLSGINPSDIIPRSRRNRAPVDYTSEEALRKAGLTREELEKEDDD